MILHQYGYRKGHSTELAALELVDRVIVDMDKVVHSSMSNKTYKNQFVPLTT